MSEAPHHVSAHVEVAFGHDGLELTVANRFRPGRPAQARGGGHGIIGMRERAALLGGTLDAGVRDGRFQLRAHLPVSGDRP